MTHEPRARAQKAAQSGKKTPQPDFRNLLKVLRREAPARPTLFEFFLNWPLYCKLTGYDIKNPSPHDHWRFLIKAFTAAGYDYVGLPGSKFTFPAGQRRHENIRTVSMNEGAVIHDRASFDAYAWQEPDQIDYSLLKDIAADLPKGMKVIVYGPGGVLENVMNLVGYENTCYMILDDPKLAHDIFDAVGSRLVRHYELAAAFPAVGACTGNDDWGFKTQTMLSTAQMREFVFPWHKRIVAAIHNAGKPAILHSCGNLAAVMDDVIDDMKYDGKHWYEDAIQPVEQAYDQYSARIAILGGIDLDFVCRAKPEEIYRRSKAMLERAPRGYALGTGNSVPDYVPDANYFAMIRAAAGDRVDLPEA